MPKKRSTKKQEQGRLTSLEAMELQKQRIGTSMESPRHLMGRARRISPKPTLEELDNGMNPMSKHYEQD